GQFGLGDDLSMAMRQIEKRFVFEGGQLDGDAVDPHLLLGGVEDEIAELEQRAGKATGASQQSIETGQDFLYLKWLDDVIVAAGLQPFHFVLPAPARREHQDRK